MMRQNPESNPEGTATAGDAELGGWLTRGLRVKGAPLSSLPPAAPLPPPSESEVLAGWLMQDLMPKHSLRPRASLPPPEPAALLAAPLAVEAWSAPPLPRSPFRDAREADPPEDAPLPPSAPSDAVVLAAAAPLDSLAPQEMTSEPPAPPSVAPSALDDDDFSVLPGRRRAAGRGRKKHALVLLGVLCLLAAIGIGLRQRGGSEAGNTASLASPSDVSAALPPPPPSEDELVATPEQPEAVRVRHRAAGATEPDDALDPLDPRNMVGGPSVRRYADVPSPTLSRLAREQRRLARERDEAVRKEKLKEIPR